MKNKIADILLKAGSNISRLFLAAVFIFSGFVKAIDPLGVQYKLQDYMHAFGLSVLSGDDFCLFLAIVLSTFEFIMGIFLLFGIRRRLMAVASFLFIFVMTSLTFYLALKNPISDCGCFGDAVVLTNWQTFYKNLVLLLLSAIFLWKPTYVLRFISEKNQWIISLYSFVFVVLLSIYCLWHLPLLDFRPYSIGSDIREKMEIPADAPKPKFETTLVYEKDGKQQEFSIDNYPKGDAWTFVDSKSVMVDEGFKPEISDLSFVDVSTGVDMTDDILSDTGYVFLLVAPHLENADDESFDLINDLYDFCEENSYRFYCATSSGAKAISRWQDLTGAEYPFLQSDEIALKTIVRANPGLVLIKKGVVVNKWSAVDIPDEYELTSTDLSSLEIAKISEMSLADKLMFVTLWYVLPLLLLTFFDRTWLGVTILRKLRQEKIFKLLNTKKMRKKIVAGNWKMNKNLQEGVALAKELNDVLVSDKPNCDVIICTPFIHLASVAGVIDQTVLGLGAENCADKVSGAYTGEVSAEMVKSTGAQYVILGHSERREYYKETPEILKEKVNLALANGLKVIFCIGETLAEREANKQNEVCKAELAGSVFDLTAEEFANVVIAYEPIWAIGTGKTATAEQAEEIHAYIRSVVAEKYGAEVADNTSILYGGSCKASNAPELFAKPNIDGGLIGGASLKVDDFKGIIDAWK